MPCSYVTGSAVFSGQDYPMEGWAQFRDEVFAGLWRRPKISALLLTGKCVERLALARVAVDCFFNQTWPNKELVVVNHGELSLVDYLPLSQRVAVREVMFTRDEKLFLGDLRNISMSYATGDWLIQWDDDDWHHPSRMEVQFSKTPPGFMSTFGWQVRCNIETGSAFYDEMPGGQHMSVFYPRTPLRYKQLNVREDTAFFEGFAGKHVVIDNSVDSYPIDPMMYVRFYHGRNIWDQKHIMGGSMQRRDEASDATELNELNAIQLRQVLGEYESASKKFFGELAASGYEKRNPAKL